MYKISKYFYPGLNKSIIRMTQEDPYRDFEVSFDEDVTNLSDSVIQEKAFKILISEFNPDGGLQETEKRMEETDERIDVLYDIVLSATNLNEKQVGTILNQYDEYNTGETYEVGESFKYEGKVYEVTKAHTATPESSVKDNTDLYKMKYDLVAVPGIRLIPNFVQPTRAHDAYKKGDRVKFAGGVYESLVDRNVQSPEVNPSVWKEVKAEE